jgi:hypothetical protein
MVTDIIAAPLAAMAACILTLVATIHMYWALGGSVGVADAISQTPKGSLSRLSSITALLVALVLILAADLMLTRLGLATARLPVWGMRLMCAALAIVFLGRAIGDFRHIGFFKRVGGSRFARLDSAIYSPVSLFLAVAIGVNVW